MTAAPPVVVVGVVGGEVFGRAAAAALAAADVLVGSPRHLALVPAPAGGGAEVLELVGPLDPILDRVGAERDAGRSVCVLASGDPGFFGITRLLAERFGAAALAVHPAPSSVSLAFAAAGVRWDDAEVISAHGRPLAGAVARAALATKAAVLTSPSNPPERLGTGLLAAGAGPRRVVVASRLGEHDEQVVHTDLAGLAAGRFDPMSVVLLLGGTDPAPAIAIDRPRAGRPDTANDPTGHDTPGRADTANDPTGHDTPGRADTASDPTGDAAPAPLPGSGGGGGGAGPALSWGAATAAFAHRDGMITKPEVRAVVLAKLALPRSGLLWDLGAGSGSVGIEAATVSPGLEVVAVERDPDDAARIATNATAHGVTERVRVTVGRAPAVLDGLPDPDRVFVGGGGPDVVEAAWERLRPGGVLVATFVVLDRAVRALDLLGDLIQLHVDRAVPIGSAGMRLQPSNPTFVCWGTR